MAKKKKFIAFKFLPGSWGLEGKAYDEAEAYYYLDGYDLDIRLAEIHYADKEFDEKKHNIDFKYGIISEYEYDTKTNELKNTGQQYDENKLAIDLKHGKIDQQEHDKTIANLRHEPWVAIVDNQYDKSQKLTGLKITLDWNEYFIEMLKDNGYNGKTEEAIIEQWYDDLHKDYYDEMIDEAWETGNFEALPNKLTNKLQNDL